MKLWILRPREDLKPYNPWEPWYDKSFGFVVRAQTEENARQIARKNSNCEGGDAWLSSTYSTCVILTCDGEPECIIEDFAKA